MDIFKIIIRNLEVHVVSATLCAVITGNVVAHIR